jgi:2,4-dienoyl-CoA reductase-like NADH-dependent reductase (Old Yellow Enzyme family)
MPAKHFPHLFSEGQIGNFDIKNRIVMLPMARQFQGFNGEVTQKTIDYYAERAKGGVGLIIVGSTRVFPPGHQFYTPASLNIGDDRYLPGHSDLVHAPERGRFGCSAIFLRWHGLLQAPTDHPG